MATRPEPIDLRVDLARNKPFGARLSRAQRQRIDAETRRLQQQLGLVAKVATRQGRRSPLENGFRELRAREHFESLAGIETLSRKLEVALIPRSDADRVENLYALIRLRIAQRVVELAPTHLPGVDEQKAIPQRLSVSLAEPLALHRMEGDLDVPMTLDRLADGATPPRLTADPFGNVAPLFKGPAHTFYLQRASRPPATLQPFVEQIEKAVTTHADMLAGLATGARFLGQDALAWLEAGKRAAMTLYLHILGGLDMYAQAIDPPGRPIDRQLNDFKTAYARNRLSIAPGLSYSDATAAGIAVYFQLTHLSLDEFRNGHIKAPALVATTHLAGRGRRRHHFLPNDPVEFGAAIGRETLMVLEALRRAPLINGGPRFDPPLPHAVAYIRYNAGDIQFLVIILNLLEKLVFGKLPRPKYPKREKPPIDRLTHALAPFKAPANQAVWTVLQRWRKERSSYYLRDRPVTRQATLRAAIAADAANFSLVMHGPKERAHMARLNTDGQMDTAEPLLNTLNSKQLWYDLEQALVAHIGSGGKPWLGHAHFLDAIGRRALRFYYMHRGFQRAFRGTAPTLGNPLNPPAGP